MQIGNVEYSGHFNGQNDPSGITEGNIADLVLEGVIFNTADFEGGNIPVKFTSDASTEFDGFRLSWDCAGI